MKFLFLFFVVGLSYATPRSIIIKYDPDSKLFDPRFKKDAEEAFRLVNVIFNSQEFQYQVSKLSFDCKSYCDGCRNIQTINGRISGNQVLDKLFSKPEVAIKLILERSGSSLGETSPGSSTTYAWYENIKDNMPDLSFAQALAVNICHEYMHTIGFCHTYCTGSWPFCPGKRKLNEEGDDPDPKFMNQDVTYTIGWLAYYILKD
ncbi:hypothetical protein HYN59_01450 [Flavobacterium album]|uniref:Lysine-specific metallo-endopeptidase domain-containing protein n=1 Tax=Flavobacterium album TaxID=2175091 RepID=A0A2S1QUC9_9FLAO|nr:hypothetical protein [Flavobacterium album]AWH83861.1 hypothetical protein HYN59_01450 [Flavobacterium album]